LGVSAPPKIRYTISLTDPVTVSSIPGAEVKRLSRADVGQLTDLMMDAYMGTIDYEGESRSEAVDEVESWFGESPLLQHSYGVILGGVLVSAVMLLSLDDRPFIGYVMTRADSKQQGQGKFVTAVALASLREAGESQVVFYITEGNTASERLFLSLGAVQQPT
jgi:hypothetical protein